MKLISFFKIAGLERRLFFEALVLIAFARIAIRFYSFQRLMKYLGKPQVETSIEELSMEERQHYRKISKAINRAAKVAFWKTVCYEKAVTAKLMLRRRKIPSTIYIGMMKEEKKDWKDTHGYARATILLLEISSWKNTSLLGCLVKYLRLRL